MQLQNATWVQVEVKSSSLTYQWARVKAALAVPGTTTTRMHVWHDPTAASRGGRCISKRNFSQ